MTIESEALGGLLLAFMVSEPPADYSDESNVVYSRVGSIIAAQANEQAATPRDHFIKRALLQNV
jgi:hypothetical protein